MSNTMAEIRAAIIDNLMSLQTDGVVIEEITQLYNLYERPSKSPNLPAIMVVGVTEIDYGDNPKDSPGFTLSVEAFVSDINDDNGWRLLDPLLMGGSSLKSLIESDKTLGGAVDDLFVSRMTGERNLPLQSVKFLGAEWAVEIVPKNT